MSVNIVVRYILFAITYSYIANDLKIGMCYKSVDFNALIKEEFSDDSCLIIEQNIHDFNYYIDNYIKNMSSFCCDLDKLIKVDSIMYLSIIVCSLVEIRLLNSDKNLVLCEYFQVAELMNMTETEIKYINKIICLNI